MNDEAEERKKLRRRTIKWYCTVSISEICGTAMLVFLSCLGMVPSVEEASSHFRGSLAAGATVYLILQIFGHISGSHINPTVTISAMIFKLVTVPAGIVYIASQFIGAIVGYGTLLLLVPSSSLGAPNSSTPWGHHFCTTVPNPNFSIIQAFALEYLADVVLVLFCWGLWDKRSQTSFDLISVKLGLAIFAIVVTFGDSTGPSLNTARTFAPALFTGTWKGHWIYWIAPITAAVFGSIFYKVLFLGFRNPGEIDPGERLESSNK